MRDEGIEIVNELEDGPVPAAAAAGRADSSGSKKYTTSCTRRGVAIRAIAALVAITGLAVALGLAFGTSAGTNGSVSSAMSSAAATVEDCLEEEKRAIAEYYNSRGRRSLRKEGSADVAAAEKIVLGEESAVGVSEIEKKHKICGICYSSHSHTKCKISCNAEEIAV